MDAIQAYLLRDFIVLGFALQYWTLLFAGIFLLWVAYLVVKPLNVILLCVTISFMDSRSVTAEVMKVECRPTGDPVARIVEIDTTKSQVRIWQQVSPTLTNGSRGPFVADISLEKIVWMDVAITGRAVSTTRYVLDRTKRTLSTDISYSWDQDDSHEIAPCK
jgi:hypothetical protein